MATRKTARRPAAPALQIGDRVRLTKNTRHKMVLAGTIGTVVEIQSGVSKYTDGITVEFMLAPSPRIAGILGLDPTQKQPFRCLFPHEAAGRNLVAVS